MGTISFIFVNQINKHSKEAIEEQLPFLFDLKNLGYNTTEGLAFARGYILYNDPDLKEGFLEKVAASESIIDNLAETKDFDPLYQLFDRIEQWNNLIVFTVFPAFENGQKEEASEILQKDVLPLSDEIITTINELSDEGERLMVQKGEQIITSSRTTLFSGITISVATTILGILIALFTSYTISNPIKKAVEHLRSITAGDLNKDILKSQSKDETGQLIEVTNKLRETMRDLLNQLHNVSKTVKDQSEELTETSKEVLLNSEQISTTMSEMATSAEFQANHSNELSQAVDSFMDKIEHVNDRGQEIEKFSTAILDRTQKGYKNMEQAMFQINEIHQIIYDAVKDVQALDDQSKKITELITVIKDIAEQTNLLALNAAIEAARAGAEGQGFAVVAEEVRQLAEGVSLSVSDITNIVEGIQKESNKVAQTLQSSYREVETGTNQILETGMTFEEISKSLEEIVGHIQSVSNTLQEVTTEGRGMNNSLQEIVSITEESAAGIEETSAASDQAESAMQRVADRSMELANLSTELHDLMSRFKL